MEDPTEEWKIQEYSSDENSGKVRWILSQGLVLGKKILVTGIVISSAPLVLPPLLVISAFGFAVSIPYGLLLASYACTEKLMSKLLPSPTPPPLLLGYGTVSKDEEYVGSDEEEGDVGFGVGGDIDMEKEEEELMEDTKGEVEKRIELGEKGNEELDEGKVSVGDDYGKGGEKKDEQILKGADEIEEKDVGTYLDKGEEKSYDEIEVNIEGMREEEEEEPVIEESRDQQLVEEARGVVVVIEAEEIENGNIEVQAPLVVRSVVVEENGDRGRVNDIIEEEELVRERRGLMEKIRDEGRSDYAEEEDKGSIETVHRGTKEGFHKDVSNVEEMEIPLEAKNVHTSVRIGEPTRGAGGAVEGKNDEEVPKESEEMRELGKVENVDTVPKEMKPIEQAGDKLEGKNVNDNNLQEGITEDSIANGVDEDVQLNKEKENVSSSNVDAREIADESGFDLFDDKKVAGQQYMYADYETPEGSEQSSSYISHESGDFLDLPVSAGVTESKRAKISSEKDTSMPSNEQVLYSEEKIWEQINAMRTIVGYKVAPHATCIEELKALYIFTGVKPPASFQDPSDLVEVNDKLQFLMSIVGVK